MNVSLKFSQTEISQIVTSLQKLPPKNSSYVDISKNQPPLILMESILSLERRYFEQVVPAIKRFVLTYPQVKTLEELKGVIDSFETPLSFFGSVLKVNDSHKATLLYEVLNYFILIYKRYPGTNQMQSLYNWAISVKPADYGKMVLIGGYQTNIPGFGPAGFQYMRMLCGANTCKPDRYIITFIKDTTGKKLNQLDAVELLEFVSPMAGISVKQADERIWIKYNANKTKSNVICNRPTEKRN